MRSITLVTNHDALAVYPLDASIGPVVAIAITTDCSDIVTGVPEYLGVQRVPPVLGFVKTRVGDLKSVLWSLSDVKAADKNWFEDDFKSILATKYHVYIDHYQDLHTVVLVSQVPIMDPEFLEKWSEVTEEVAFDLLSQYTYALEEEMA